MGSANKTASESARGGSVRASIDGWHESLALTRLTEEAQRYASIIGVELGDVTVRDFKARWGSCYPSGAIAYNCHVIMAPQRLVD